MYVQVKMYSVEELEAEWQLATMMQNEQHGLECWEESKQPLEMFGAASPHTKPRLLPVPH